jgi:hypothetical protein
LLKNVPVRYTVLSTVLSEASYMYSFLDQSILYYLLCHIQKYLKLQSKNRFLLICFGLKTLLFCLIKSINCVWAQGCSGFREPCTWKFLL